MEIRFNYKLFLLAVLIISQQFFLLKFGSASLPILLFIFCSLLSALINSSVYFIFTQIFVVCITIFGVFNIISTIDNRYFNEALQYTLYFPLFQLMIISSFVQLSGVFRDLKSNKALEFIVLISIFIAFLSLFIQSPNKMFLAMDGRLGFFSEKGLFSYYVSLLSIFLVILNRSVLYFIIAISVLSYSLIIQEASRVLLLIASYSLVLIYLDLRHGKNKYIFMCAFLLIILVPISFYLGFFDKLILKLTLITEYSGGVGRYAASYMISKSNLLEILVGHGYPFYIYDRYTVLPMHGQLYDYAGSLFFELFYEIGALGYLVVLLIVTRLVFGSISVLLLMSIFILTLVGGKHDVQMYFSFLILQISFIKLREVRLSHTN